MIRFHATAGDGSGWAIDEDLRLIRCALEGVAREAPLASADVVHCPFWLGLEQYPQGILSRRFVIAHADNPPFFYLTQPGFAVAQRQVDLWVARSREALGQFQRLGLPVCHIPYAIDPEIFFPLDDKEALRKEFGLPADRYLIGNFHRDSEGADLAKPKLQKAPELMVGICRRLIEAGAPVHVVLAGPRRHWIRSALAAEGVPFTFVGDGGIAGDDFGPNILPRDRLNRLTNACDLYLVPSRWEGGPQSAMEAAACRTKILSTRVGVALDILEPASLFETPGEAVEAIVSDIRTSSLGATIDPQFQRWEASHTSACMAAAFRRLYEELPPRVAAKARCHPVGDMAGQLLHRIQRRLGFHRRGTTGISLVHEDGQSQELDRIIHSLDLPGRGKGGVAAVAGWVADPQAHAGEVAIQLAGPDFSPAGAIPGACLVMPSAQDAVNYRAAGGNNPVVVLPVGAHDGVAISPGTSPESRSSHMVVEADDRNASQRVIEALRTGVTVIHPDSLDYGSLVSLAGVTYGRARTRDKALALANEEGSALARLARLPDAGTIRTFLEMLVQVLDKRRATP